MTDGAELIDLLHEWERRLRELGAPCASRLRAGLSREEVDATTATAGVDLPADAAAIWMWHDGDRARLEDDWGRPSLTPWKTFLSLQAALERSTWMRRITDQVRPPGANLEAGPYEDEGTAEELYFRRTFVVLDEAEDPSTWTAQTLTGRRRPASSSPTTPTARHA